MTTFDKYAAALEKANQERLNRTMNEEISRRMEMRTEEEAFAALLSLSLFALAPKSREALSERAALPV